MDFGKKNHINMCTVENCPVCKKWKGEELAEEYQYDFIRMPAIGKKGLTILEAKLDSAKVMIHLGSDPKKILDRLHDALKIVRNAIAEDKLATPDHLLIKRCTFRETVDTRCNKIPVKTLELPDGKVVYRCKTHYDLELQSVQPEIPKEPIKLAKLTDFVECSSN